MLTQLATYDVFPGEKSDFLKNPISERPETCRPSPGQTSRLSEWVASWVMLKVLVIMAQVLQTDLLKTDQDNNMNRDRYFAC